MSTSAHSLAASRGQRWGRRVAITLGVIVAVLILIQLIASPIAKAVVNKKLAQLDGYQGHVDKVSIALWRGGVGVGNFALFEKDHLDDPPVVRVPKASMAIAWSALFQGKIGGRATVESAEVTVVKRRAVSPSEAAEKTGEKVQESKEKIARWQDALRKAFPVEVTRFELKDSHVRFIDRTHEPQVDVGIEHLHIVATDLQNRPKANGDPLPARVDVTGVTTGSGKLHATLKIDPLAKQPYFATTFELKAMQLPAFNSFMLAYADADVSRGTFEVYMEINAKDGGYNGYVKPLFSDLDFTNPSDQDKSVGERIKEKAVSAVTTLLKSDEDQKVATKAPISGNFDQNDVDIWTTVVNLLRNAFVQAIRGGLEGQTPTKK